MSVKHKVSGFFAAIIIAVVSFFVLFFFFPQYADKYLGVSFQSNKEAQKTVVEKASELAGKASQVVSDTLKK